MRARTALALLAPLAGCAPASNASREAVDLFVAASLAPAVEELFADESGVVVNAAATSTLARQLERGARADLFVSADDEWLDWLVERDLVDPTSVRAVAGNHLVWVEHAAAATDASPLALAPGVDLAARFEGRLATGDPEHVPLGRYARRALVTLGAWEDLEPRLTPALDARAALRLVELGECGAGLVYASDAAASDAVVVRAALSAELTGSVRYRAALVCGADPRARALLDRLTDARAADVFAAHGLAPPGP